MGGTFTSWGALEAAITSELVGAVEEAVEKSYRDADTEMHGFYSQGTPLYYSRTGQLGGIARRTGVVKSSSTAMGEVYLDTSIGYSTGTPGFPVVEQAEVFGSGILGRGGFWQRTVAKIPLNLHMALSKRFG